MICHSWIVLFLIPPVIVKCSSEFLMEFGINWHPAIRLSGRGGRGERRLGWHGNGNNLQFAREGWLGCHWPDVVCVLMTQEDFVVPIIVSSLICRHLFVQSLLCYNLFLIYSHQPSRSLSALFINIKPHQSWKETEILYKLYLFDDKSTASLTFATQNIGGICWLRVWI